MDRPYYGEPDRRCGALFAAALVLTTVLPLAIVIAFRTPWTTTTSTTTTFWTTTTTSPLNGTSDPGAAQPGSENVSEITWCIAGDANADIAVHVEQDDAAVDLNESGQRLSCQEQQQLGEDPQIWAAVAWAWKATRVVFAWCVFLLAHIIYFALSGGGILLMSMDAKSCIHYHHGFDGIILVNLVILIIIYAILAVTAPKAFEWLCWVKRLMLSVSLLPILLLVAAVILAVLQTLIIVTIFCPLAAKLEWFHMERAILLCVPLPDDRSLSVSKYTFPVYSLYICHHMFKFVKAKWDYMDSTGVITSTFGIPWTSQQIATDAFDAYTDLSTLVTNVGQMSMWWEVAWALTSLSSLWMTIGFAVGGYLADEGTYAWAVGMKLITEDTLQVCLAGWKLVISLTQALPCDQYTVYSFLTALLSTMTLGKKFYLYATSPNALYQPAALADGRTLEDGRDDAR